MWIDSLNTWGTLHSYTVKPGDTLSKIAKDNGFKNWQELAKLQPQWFNPHKLKLEQEIILRKNISIATLEDSISEISRWAQRAQSLKHLQEPISVDPLIELDSLLPGGVQELPQVPKIAITSTEVSKWEKPEWLSETEDALWDICSHLGIDASQFQDQQIRKQGDGSIRITAPWSRWNKMSDLLRQKIWLFRRWELTISVDTSLGEKLEELYRKSSQGKSWEKIRWISGDISVIKDMSEILLWKVKWWTETPYDDRLAEFRRKYVKNNFWSYRAAELPEEIKPEAKILLGQYAGITEPEKIYQVTIEKALSWGTMHSIVSSIMIALWGEYEKYGEELRKRINDGDLRGTTTRV
jgi:transcriptional regulator with XRE-family HTH domain